MPRIVAKTQHRKFFEPKQDKIDCFSRRQVAGILTYFKTDNVEKRLFYLILASSDTDATAYGEMITYLGMTMPMAVFALISWLRNPFNGNKAEVKVNIISKKETIFMWIITVLITTIFYFILEYFNTACIVPSTLSVTTSFLAVYLTFRRSPYFALAYATNDIVLILLWILASFSDIRYISVVVCFVAFLCSDIYGFISWQKMKARQSQSIV